MGDNHSTKNLNKLLKKILSNDEFIMEETSGRGTTFKVIHTKSKNFYLVHPGEGAVKPLGRWYNRQLKLHGK